MNQEQSLNLHIDAMKVIGAVETLVEIYTEDFTNQKERNAVIEYLLQRVEQLVNNCYEMVDE